MQHLVTSIWQLLTLMSQPSDIDVKTADIDVNGADINVYELAVDG